MEVQIEYDYEPMGNCPVQAEGTINGKPFYFRARGQGLCLYIAEVGGDPVDMEDGYCEEYTGEVYQYWLNQGKNTDYTAGWAKPEECKDFIERAAHILMSRETVSQQPSLTEPNKQKV